MPSVGLQHKIQNQIMERGGGTGPRKNMKSGWNVLPEGIYCHHFILSLLHMPKVITTKPVCLSSSMNREVLCKLTNKHNYNFALFSPKIVHAWQSFSLYKVKVHCRHDTVYDRYIIAKFSPVIVTVWAVCTIRDSMFGHFSKTGLRYCLNLDLNQQGGKLIDY